MSARLACVRPAASVRSEPGSNSQVESAEALSLTSNLRTSVTKTRRFRDQSLSVPSRLSDPTKTVKLTPRSSDPHPHRQKPYWADMLAFAVETTKPPAYPFIHHIFKERRRPKPASRTNHLAHPTNFNPRYQQQKPQSPPNRRFKFRVPASPPASMRRYLRITEPSRKRKKTVV